jgi:Raf kinase inhibitor-like YbhB/YbcL family protein
MERKKRFITEVLLVAIFCWQVFATQAAPGVELSTAQKITLASPAFKAGSAIPRQYSCDGSDVSPPLAWKNAPALTRSLALIADDPDAPGGTWVHWVIYDLPAVANELAEGIARGATLTSGARQGLNDFGQIGYGGPCPPPGPAHRYFFRLYALDTETGLKPGASKTQLLDRIRGHVLGQVELMGRYGR